MWVLFQPKAFTKRQVVTKQWRIQTFWWGWGQSSRLWDKGGALSPKISFQLFGPHFGPKIRGRQAPLGPPLPNFLSYLWLSSCTHNFKIPPCQYFLVREKEIYGQNSIKIKPIKHFGALKVLLNMIKNPVTSLEWVLWRLSRGLRHWDGVCRILSVWAN